MSDDGPVWETDNNGRPDLPLQIAKAAVERWYNKFHTDKIGPDQIYIVWSCYILGNWKALLSTDVSDGHYYEVTYNKASDEIYLDDYRKVANETLVIS